MIYGRNHFAQHSNGVSRRVNEGDSLVSNQIKNDSRVISSLQLLSTWIESQTAYKEQPGLSIGIVYDQQLVWANGFGHAAVEQNVPSTSETIYRIASNTKLFTAVAILQLRDAGKLSLETSIVEFLPWFKLKHSIHDSKPITVKHLITHTSGLPREAAFPYWTEDEFPTLEQIKDGLCSQEQILPPENRWKYSNLALSLAGEIVSVVAGCSYPDYVRKNILDPLGMSNTFVDSIPRDHPLLATGYSRRLPRQTRVTAPYTNSRGLTPAFNMASNVEDLSKFLMLQFRNRPVGGNQILSGSTLQEMQRPH